MLLMKLKRILIKLLIIIIAVYTVICAFMFFVQERLIFIPEKLDASFQFAFEGEFEERFIPTQNGAKIHGLLFKADSSKGLVFYLHGNAGSLREWGDVAKTYTDLNYDVFIMDYPGYGKSDGKIDGEEQLFSTVQQVYDEIKKDYSEEDIIILGYSIGTGIASKIASTNNPRLLILQAPYYSLIDIKNKSFPFVPSFILKYKFETNKYLQDCSMPVVLFHGTDDEVIYYGSSKKLEKEFKPTDTLITLQGLGHNGMTYDVEYQTALKRFLMAE